MYLTIQCKAKASIDFAEIDSEFAVVVGALANVRCHSVVEIIDVVVERDGGEEIKSVTVVATVEDVLVRWMAQFWFRRRHEVPDVAATVVVVAAALRFHVDIVSSITVRLRHG